MTRLYLTLFMALAIAVSTVRPVYAAPPPTTGTQPNAPTPPQLVFTDLEHTITNKVEVNGKPRTIVMKLKKILNGSTVEYHFEATGCEECDAAAGGTLTQTLTPAQTANMSDLGEILEAIARDKGFAEKKTTQALAEEAKKIESAKKAKEKAEERAEMCEIKLSGNPPVEEKFDDKKDPTERIECWAEHIKKVDSSTDKDSVIMAKLIKFQKKLKPAYLNFMKGNNRDETLDTALNSALDALEGSKFKSISDEASHIRAIALAERRTKIENEMKEFALKYVADRNQNQYALASQDEVNFAAKFSEFQNATAELRTAGLDYRTARGHDVVSFPDPADDAINSVTSNPTASFATNNTRLSTMRQELATMNRNGGNRPGGANSQNSNDYIPGLDPNPNGSNQNRGTVAQNGVTFVFSRGVDSQGNEILSRGTPAITYSPTSPPILNLFPAGATNWQQSQTPGLGALAMNSTPPANQGQFVNRGQLNNALLPQGRRI